MYGGKKLRQLRQHLGLNQDEFATELKISQPYYSAIESGKKPITNKILDQLQVKWQIKKEYFDTNSIKSPSEFMGVKNGGNVGGNEFITSEHDNNSLKNSPAVKKVRTFWNLVREHDKELDKSLDALDRLESLKIDLGIYLNGIDDVINKILDGVQAVDYKTLTTTEFIQKSILELSFVKDQHKTIDELNSLIESVLVFIDHDKNAINIGGNQADNN